MENLFFNCIDNQPVIRVFKNKEDEKWHNYCLTLPTNRMEYTENGNRYCKNMLTGETQRIKTYTEVVRS